MEKYDKIIIGAGIYGMYAAKRSLEKNPNEKVLILEVEKEPFNRGSYINIKQDFTMAIIIQDLFLRHQNLQNISIDSIMILKRGSMINLKKFMR